MSNLHIYRSPGQPLTKPQRCPWIMERMVFPALKPNRLVWTSCCRKQRPAKNCRVQHYYDGSYVWCDDGKGCKHPAVARLKAKRKSFASRRGWETRKRNAARVMGRERSDG